MIYFFQYDDDNKAFWLRRTGKMCGFTCMLLGLCLIMIIIASYSGYFCVRSSVSIIS